MRRRELKKLARQPLPLATKARAGLRTRVQRTGQQLGRQAGARISWLDK